MPVDTRFYRSLGTLTIGEIVALTGARLDPADPSLADTIVSGLSSAPDGREGEVVFLDGDLKDDVAVSDAAAACFVSESNRSRLPDNVPALISNLPRYDHLRVAQSLFASTRGDDDGVISAEAAIADSAVISPNVVIGAGAAIGEGTRIGPNATIGLGVQIGRNCIIGANASVNFALVGDNVTLSAGTRVGENGFGVTAGPEGIVEIPHYGRVIIQDHVSVGANSCVDRGVFDDTIIGERTRIDNLCQIAHNVIIGRNVIMAAFCGISGSVKIGDGAMLGGRVGIADHVTVGKNAVVAASAGLFRNIPDGEKWGGTPAKPLNLWMRETAWLQKQVRPKKAKPE